jgi:hypothetical protein
MKHGFRAAAWPRRQRTAPAPRSLMAVESGRFTTGGQPDFDLTGRSGRYEA